MKLQEIGVALIGTGFMGAVHTEALKRVGVRLVGILGSTPEKSANAAAALGYAKGYASLDALLADPNVHAVHVNTPNRLHLSQTLACLTAGKHEAVCADFTTVHPVRRRPVGEVETFSTASVATTEPIPITRDDYGAVLLRFGGGTRGCFFVSQVSPGRKYRVAFELAGQNATLAWNSEDCESLWTGRREGASTPKATRTASSSASVASISTSPPETFRPRSPTRRSPTATGIIFCVMRWWQANKPEAG